MKRERNTELANTCNQDMHLKREYCTKRRTLKALNASFTDLKK